MDLGQLPPGYATRTKELDRRRVNEAQSANQNKGLHNDVQNAWELLIIEILQIFFQIKSSITSLVFAWSTKFFHFSIQNIFPHHIAASDLL